VDNQPFPSIFRDQIRFMRLIEGFFCVKHTISIHCFEKKCKSAILLSYLLDTGWI
jgi:hypothetical protein